MIHLDTNYLIGLLIKIATVNQADFKPFLPHGVKLASSPPPTTATGRPSS
jgi:hypothetical protein